MVCTQSRFFLFLLHAPMMTPLAQTLNLIRMKAFSIVLFKISIKFRTKKGACTPFLCTAAEMGLGGKPKSGGTLSCRDDETGGPMRIRLTPAARHNFEKKASGGHKNVHTRR